MKFWEYPRDTSMKKLNKSSTAVGTAVSSQIRKQKAEENLDIGRGVQKFSPVK